MKLRILFIQRQEAYEGEYAVEALCVEDEYTRDENPTWFVEQCQKELANIGDLAGHAVVEFELPQDKIRAFCLGQDHKVDAILGD